jgi:putative endonuclease
MEKYNKRTQWNKWEELVAEYYIERGFFIIWRNITYRNGELDIVATKDGLTVFIEAKIVNVIDEIHDYISASKLSNLMRSIQIYCMENPKIWMMRLDVAFVRHGKVIEVFENVTM